nr:EOG090X098F [Triops cancriformis]
MFTWRKVLFVDDIPNSFAAVTGQQSEVVVCIVFERTGPTPSVVYPFRIVVLFVFLFEVKSITSSRTAPVLEKHLCQGGELIIAWLPDSDSSTDVNDTSGEMAAPNHSSGPAAQQGGSFINKPARGWLHPDTLIAREGIAYVVRYIGSLEIHTSMKSLDFDTRSQVAKECIHRVCEAAGLKVTDKKRKVERRISRILGESPRMAHAGTEVELTITSSCLRLTALDTGFLVASHDMPNISFASGGDLDTLDFVAYVAKDNMQGRTCLVLECGDGLAQDVITTIGQAFELRFREYLKRTPESGSGALACSTAGPPQVANRYLPMPELPPASDPDYYNDLPGKVPPDLAPPVPPLPEYHPPNILANSNVNVKQTNKLPQTQQRSLAVHLSQQQRPSARHGLALDDNLIDLNAEVSNPPINGGQDHDYVNGHVVEPKDPFDMHPFSSGLPSPLLPPANPNSASTFAPFSGGNSDRGVTSCHQALLQEPWFHGVISRKEAEGRLQTEGDFLVRESQGSHGQYVLTGLQGGQFKHLLLVDPEGVVRTKDLTFTSVSHLIHYHRTNGLPIISAESALLLRRPVQRS